MKKLTNEMKDALQAVTDLKTILDSGITAFKVACGREPGRLLPVSDALGTVQCTVVSFILITEQAVEFTECQPTNGIRYILTFSMKVLARTYHQLCTQCSL